MNRQPVHLQEADRERGAALFLRARESNDPSDARALERWIDGDDSRQRLVEGLGRVWNGVGEVSDAVEVVRWRKEKAVAGPHPFWSRGRVNLALAASLVLTISIGAALSIYVALQPQAERQFATSIGERRQITLPDGSGITLDAASRIAIGYTPDERIVRLVNGQAHFRVAHDPDRPFHVEVAGEDVRALGTEFNIATVGNTLSVSLIAGSVLVSRIEERAAFFGLSKVPVKMPIVTLRPGQQFERSSYGRERLRRFDPQIVNAWQNGRLVFENLPLPDAIALANRYSRRTIVLDREFTPINMTGVFNAGDGLGFAEAVASYLPGAQVMASSNRIVIRRAENFSSSRR